MCLSNGIYTVGRKVGQQLHGGGGVTLENYISNLISCESQMKFICKLDSAEKKNNLKNA